MTRYHLFLAHLFLVLSYIFIAAGSAILIFIIYDLFSENKSYPSWSAFFILAYIIVSLVIRKLASNRIVKLRVMLLNQAE